MLNQIKVGLKLKAGINPPVYMTEHSAGLDLQASEDIEIVSTGKGLVPTGIMVSIPEGYEGQIRPRSGLALREDILIPNSPGTIDSDYRGELKVIIWNLGKKDFIIKKGDRIAQLVIVPVVRADFVVMDELGETNRASGGFGHTGK